MRLNFFFRNGDSLSIASELTNEIDELVAKKLLEAYRAMELVWNSIPKINDYSTIDKDLLKNINRYVQGVYQAAKEALEKVGLADQINNFSPIASFVPNVPLFRV